MGMLTIIVESRSFRHPSNSQTIISPIHSSADSQEDSITRHMTSVKQLGSPSHTHNLGPSSIRSLETFRIRSILCFDLLLLVRMGH